MNKLKRFFLRTIEVSIALSFLLYVIEISIGSELLAPYPWRATFVMLSYCLLFLVYSFFRLNPKQSKSEILPNVGIVVLAQAISSTIVMVILRIPENEDLTRIEWLLYKLPFVLVITALGALIVQFVLRYFDRKMKLNVFKNLGS